MPFLPSLGHWIRSHRIMCPPPPARSHFSLAERDAARMHRAITLVLVLVGLLSAYGVPGQAEATVSSLWTDQVCAGDGTVNVRLTWGPLNAYAIDQWLDLVWYDPFIGADMQQTSKPLSAGANSINWGGLTPDMTYYAWVTQRFASN